MKKLILPLILSLSAVAEPVGSILFNNNTDIHLDAYIAGHKGRDIAPGVQEFPVPYFYLSNSCGISGLSENCPVEFFNRATGELAARVNINAETGQVIGAPVLLGSFSTGYSVNGWNQVPVRNIIINKG